MKKIILFAVAAILTLTACGESNSTSLATPDGMIGILQADGYYDITPQEAKALSDDTSNHLVIIDVSPDWASGHLPGALSLYIGSGDLDAAIPELDKNRPYLVYCHSDTPARAGAKKLVDAGFTPVYRLIGNYSAWVDAGYPVTTE